MQQFRKKLQVFPFAFYLRQGRKAFLTAFGPSIFFFFTETNANENVVRVGQT